MIGAHEAIIELDAVQVDRAAGVGLVVDAGEHARGLVDRRVLVGPVDPCGECDVCRRGGAAVCPLAVRRDTLGTRTIAAARWLVPLGDGLELPLPGAAAVAGDVALAYTLYARTGVGPREPVVVVGSSPITRFLVEILRAKGIAPTAIAAPGPWADWLTAKGVIVAADRAGLSAAFALQSLGTKPWRVICGDPRAAADAAALAGPRATLTLLAIADAPRSLDGRGVPPAGGDADWQRGSIDSEALAREVTIIGVAGAHPDLVVEVAALCAKGEIDLAAGVTEAPTELPCTRVRGCR